MALALASVPLSVVPSGPAAGQAEWTAGGKDAAGRDAAGEAAGRCALQSGETVKIAGIVDGDTVLLDDGREVRLKGIQAPKLPLGRTGFKPWPLSDEAKERLDELAGGGAALLRYGGARGDRHGRVLAHVFVQSSGKEEVWLQQAMLREGLARVYTFPDNRACAALLLATEGEARAALRGIWADPFYAIRDAADPAGLNRLAGRFELVEGRIHKAALVRGRLYLNFGEDYRTDFTVTVQERDVRILRRDEAWAAYLQSEDAAVPGLDRLAGRTVRVRGWIGRNNGPEITVNHSEQIEFTDKQD